MRSFSCLPTRLAQSIAVKDAPPCWVTGRRLVAVDGSCLDRPDTPPPISGRQRRLACSESQHSTAEGIPQPDSIESDLCEDRFEGPAFDEAMRGAIGEVHPRSCSGGSEVITGENAAGPEHARDLCDCLLPVDNVVQHQETYNEIKSFVIEGKLCGVALARSRVRILCETFPCGANHHRVIVDHRQAQRRICPRQLGGRRAITPSDLKNVTGKRNTLYYPPDDSTRRKTPWCTAAERTFKRRHCRHDHQPS